MHYFKFVLCLLIFLIFSGFKKQVNDLVIKVNGKSFDGWKTVELTRSIEQITSSFRIEASNKHSGEPKKWDIKNGDVCELWINDKLVLTGYIDAIGIDYDKENQVFSLSGRDKTGDLVDCSYTGANELLGLTVEAIIEILCRPFNITVDLSSFTIGSDFSRILTQVVPRFETDQGDSVFTLITKLTKTRGILPISTGNGKLFLTRAGVKQANDSLETGVNILSGSFLNDDKDRFSHYWVKSQGELTDQIALENTFQVGGQALDGRIQRFRPLIILSEDELTIESSEVMATWESKRRAARSRKVVYITQGWVQSNGIPWTINELVRVKDSVLNLDESFLIVSVIYTLDEKAEGTITELTLAHKEGYEVFESPVEEIANDFDNLKASPSTIPVRQFQQGVFEIP